MKRTVHPALVAALAFGASTVYLFAQSPSASPQGSPGGNPPPPHHGPPPSPLFEALDANHDGTISADEIANAPAVLKTLAGTSGQLTRDSLRPPGPGKDDRGPRDDREKRPHPGKDDRDANTNPPADHRHGPPPDGERGQRRKDPAPTDPSATPSVSVSPGPDGRGPGGHHGPPHGGPLFDALDTNHDGTISADEIANAATALKTLDKNNDGQLTHEELRPPAPPHGPEN